MGNTIDNKFEPNDCPIGISNNKSIENLGDRVDMAIERLTEKVGELKEDITSLSKNVDKKFDSIDEKIENVDKKIDSMEDKFYERMSELKKKIPATVEAEIDKKKANAAAAAIKWMLCGILGTILVSVATAWIKSKLGV